MTSCSRSTRLLSCARAIFISVGTCAGVVSSALAQHTYTGGAGDNLWCNPMNWNPASVPSGMATIPGPITQRVRMAGNCTPNFQSLTAIGPVLFDGEVRYSGAVIAADIIIQPANFTVGPTTSGGATLSLTDAAAWRSGTIANQNVTVEGSATLALQPGAPITLRNAGLLNDGFVHQTAFLSATGNAPITNTGVWTFMASGVGIRRVAITDAVSVSNSGVFDTNHPGPTALIQVPLVNTGELRASVGDLEVAAVSEHTGARLSASPGRRVTLSGPAVIRAGVQASGDGSVVARNLVDIANGVVLTALDTSGLFGGGFVLDSSQGMAIGSLGSLDNVGTFVWRDGPIVGGFFNARVVTNRGRFVVNAALETLSRVELDNLGSLIIDLGGSQMLLEESSLLSAAGSTMEWRGGAILRSAGAEPIEMQRIEVRGELRKTTLSPARTSAAVRLYGGSSVRVFEGELRLDNADAFNSNLIVDSFVDVSGGARFVLGGRLEVVQPGASIRGEGTFLISGGTLFIPVGTPFYSDMTSPSAGLHVMNGTIEGGGSLYNREVMTLSGATIGGSGPSASLTRVVSEGFLNVRDSGQTISGSIENFGEMAVDARITLIGSGAIVNFGDISVGEQVAIVAGGVAFTGGLFNGEGATLSKREANGSSISAPFSNMGRVVVQQGRLDIFGPVEQLVPLAGGGFELNGGTWDVRAGTTLSLGNRNIRTTSGDAHVVVDGRFDDYEPTRLRDQSRTELGTLLDPSEDVIASEQAQIHLDVGGSIGPGAPCPQGVCPGLRLQGGAWLTGLGVVDRPSTLEDEATIAPGNSPGILTFAALTMQGGRLDMELGGPNPGSQHDVVAVRTHATLGGTLLVRMLPGFSPQNGAEFDILTAGSISGNFGRVEAAGLRSDQRAVVSVQSDRARVTIVQACPADLDDGSGAGVSDGGVTIDDLLYFLEQFTLGTSRADLDDGSGAGLPDGGVTIDDLLYLIERYEAGC